MARLLDHQRAHIVTINAQLLRRVQLSPGTNDDASQDGPERR
ncbi:MAG TPA: hypothetical protein VFY20_09530 [Gemmatimonadales bacterium]|nr:hypothetical protein [Gemmatimonadales bacterium]